MDNDVNDKYLTKQEIKNRMQYWYSKYCNSITRDERKIYLNLYKDYIELNDFWELSHKYV